MHDACEVAVARPEVEELLIDAVLETLLLPRVIGVTVEDAIAREEVVFRHKVLREQDRARQRLAESVYKSLVEREVKLLLKSELELEYFARLTLEDLLSRAASQAIEDGYVEVVALDEVSEDMLASMVKISVNAVYESEQTWRAEQEITDEMVSSTLRDMMEDTCREVLKLEHAL